MSKKTLLVFIIVLIIGTISVAVMYKKKSLIGYFTAVDRGTSQNVETSPTSTPTSSSNSKSSDIVTAIRISHKVSDAQIDFINKHYDYVMTPFLSKEIRKSVSAPQLILYRSIQGTWEGFSQFDWEHINSNENMFCHHDGKRIKTAWNSWLMDGNDIVAKGDPDELNHWVNYYAITASEQVYKYDYDGLFIDSASHRLSTGAVKGVMPDDYSDYDWQQGRYKALVFIKSYLPDKAVIFNGLHSDFGAEKSLSFTDGGMWETFIFEPATGRYYGEKKWKEAIELVERNKADKLISIVSKKYGLTKSIDDRLFILASFLLVKNENVALTMSDLDYDGTDAVLYYPEYDLKTGKALGSYVFEGNTYKREFEKALVLVNPSSSKIYSVTLDRDDYKQVVPVGGGIVNKDGSWSGRLEYKSVGREIELPPRSGIILFK